MKRLAIIAPLIALAVACGQQPKVELDKTLGVVSLPVGETVSTQATYIADETGISFTKTAGGSISDTKRNAKYLWATYTVNNVSTTVLNRLTLVALNEAGNAGGTAIKNLQNFGGGDASAYAQKAQPGHKMTENVGAAATIDPSGTHFQLFNTADLTAFNIPSTVGTALEYGYQVSSGNTISVSYKVPFGSDPTTFSATFALVNDGPDRVSQSADESAAAVNARATSVTEVAYVGPRAANTSQVAPPGNVTNTLRLANPKTATGTTNAFLLNEYVYASFLTGSSVNEGGYGYGYAYNVTTAPDYSCAAGCTTNGANTANGYSQTATFGGASNGGLGSAVRPFVNSTNAPLAQNLSKYRKMKIFASTSTGTTVDVGIVYTGNNDKLVYTKAANATLSEITIDLTQPNCALGANPTCTAADITTALSTANTLEVGKFVGSNITASTEIGNVVFFDYQP
jgi:hypothetical protein